MYIYSFFYHYFYLHMSFFFRTFAPAKVLNRKFITII